MGVPWRSADSVAFMLMQSIIGSYRKGEGLVPGKLSGNRVTNNIANKMNVGCADMYSAFNTCYKDTGLFGVYAQCEEVERAKRQLKHTLFGSLDSTTNIAEDIGRQLLVYGRRIPAIEFVTRLDAIDAEEVKRVAYKYLHDAEIAVTALGPLHGIPSYYELRKMTAFHR